MYKFLIFIILISINNKLIIASNNECVGVDAVCSVANNCRDCIRENHCCVWLYDKDFKGQRCFAKNNTNYQEFDSSLIENNAPTFADVIQNKSFTNVEENVSEAVQFSPQEFNISLRYDDPINITIHYQPAMNFPLDLYYLMDLTWSMKPDLEILKTLGSQLTLHLEKLTKNYRIAFGTYIDKPEMPFYDTAPTYMENPCIMSGATCDKGYIFKHKINFTNDVNMFIEKVKKSDVSANLDDLEGGLDAIMQILLCGENLGWLGNSRKLILVATEGGMHLAGDGILAGYTKRNEKECLIDYNGNYVLSQHYDYPSLAEVHRQLKETKTNIIVAAKSHIHNYYNNMRDVLKESIYVGELKINSTNVLNLVNEGYYSFIRKVKLFTSKTDGVKIDYFADCDGDGTWEKKEICTNAEENKVMNFKVQFTLTKYQDKESEVLYIEENNIQEKIKINLHYIGSKCICPHLNQQQLKTCEHGEFNCGDCLCEEKWKGDSCSEECINNYSLCRYVDDNGIPSLTCSGRGDCICGKCACYSKRYQGEFCQYECPYNKQTQQVCGGHGICINSTCVCDKEYTEKTCSCHNSTENCRIPGYDDVDSVCNGKGKCLCNKCHCNDGYSGNYCEDCGSCQRLCGRYQSNVVEHVINRNAQTEPVRVEIVEDLPEEKRSCIYQFEKDEKKCQIFYTYTIIKNRTVVVKATEPICTAPLSAGFLVGVIIAAFVALLALIIIVWKGRNMVRDRQEYQKFLENQDASRHSEMNPIYKNPIVTYQNPMDKVSIHAKAD